MDFMHWLPALLALATGITVIVTIREQSKHTSAGHEKLSNKVDSIHSDVSTLKTDVAVLKDRSERGESTVKLKAVQ